MVQINQVQTRANLEDKLFFKTLARDLAYVHWFPPMLQAF